MVGDLLHYLTRASTGFFEGTLIFILGYLSPQKPQGCPLRKLLFVQGTMGSLQPFRWVAFGQSEGRYGQQGSAPWKGLVWGASLPTFGRPPHTFYVLHDFNFNFTVFHTKERLYIPQTTYRQKQKSSSQVLITVKRNKSLPGRFRSGLIPLEEMISDNSF